MFGEKLKKLRIAANLTQLELSHLLKVTDVTNKLAAQAPGFIHGDSGFFCFLKESLKDDKRVKIID